MKPLDCSFLEVIKSDFATFWSCKQHAGTLEISTPFLYPNSSLARVFITQRDDRFIVTDNGDIAEVLSEVLPGEDLVVGQSISSDSNQESIARLFLPPVLLETALAFNRETVFTDAGLFDIPTLHQIMDADFCSEGVHTCTAKIVNAHCASELVREIPKHAQNPIIHTIAGIELLAKLSVFIRRGVKFRLERAQLILVVSLCLLTILLRPAQQEDPLLGFVPFFSAHIWRSLRLKLLNLFFEARYRIAGCLMIFRLRLRFRLMRHKVRLSRYKLRLERYKLRLKFLFFLLKSRLQLARKRLVIARLYLFLQCLRLVAKANKVRLDFRNRRAVGHKLIDSVNERDEGHGCKEKLSYEKTACEDSIDTASRL